MNGNIEKEILGEYTDQGFSLQEVDGHTELYLKEARIKIFPPGEATEQNVREAIEQFLKRDQEIECLLHKAEVECGLCDVEHSKLNRLIAEQGEVH